MTTTPAPCVVYALEVAYSCGLATAGEALSNVEIHAGSLYRYEEIGQRLAEMQQGFAGIDPQTKVRDLLGAERCAALDQEFADLLGAEQAEAELLMPEPIDWPKVFGQGRTEP